MSVIGASLLVGVTVFVLIGLVHTLYSRRHSHKKLPDAYSPFYEQEIRRW